MVIDAGEATARVRAAHAAGSRRCLTGEPLPARYPVVAAAQAAGALAAKQARVITTTLNKLPDSLVEEIPAVEARLVGFARTFDATSLQQLADRERDWLDPAAQARRRRQTAAGAGHPGHPPPRRLLQRLV